MRISRLESGRARKPNPGQDFFFFFKEVLSSAIFYTRLNAALSAYKPSTKTTIKTTP